MKARNAQKGVTMWGIMLIILIGVFFLFLFFKLVSCLYARLGGFLPTWTVWRMEP